jgi:hypothetical protein
MQKSTPVFPSVPVTFTSQSLVSHAGAAVLTGFMDALGFGALCEDRLGQFVPPGAKHRPGRLLGSMATMLAAGGEHVSDLDILRVSPGVFGQLPSNATVSRFFERTATNPELFGYGTAAFANYAGTAPVEIASTDKSRHRLSRRGDRQLNSALHTIAITQIRTTGSRGNLYYKTKPPAV